MSVLQVLEDVSTAQQVGALNHGVLMCGCNLQTCIITMLSESLMLFTAAPYFRVDVEFVTIRIGLYSCTCILFFPCSMAPRVLC